jgi:hypothetical protein
MARPSSMANTKLSRNLVAAHLERSIKVKIRTNLTDTLTVVEKKKNGEMLAAKVVSLNGCGLSKCLGKSSAKLEAHHALLGVKIDPLTEG